MLVLWLEMSRDYEHGGSSWGFTQSLWAPTQKQSYGRPNGQTWPCWENLLRVRTGDVVLHLREDRQHRSAFVGFSTAATDGKKTAERPPHPGPWGYDTHFYRVLLHDFRPFAAPLDLRTVFTTQEQALRDYFERNKQRPKGEKRTLFYVIQAGRLQCFNGGYLSEVDEELAALLLSSEIVTAQAQEQKLDQVAVETSEQIAQMRRRVGQQSFAEKVRANYHMQCCFPECPIAEARFLVGSHIARWADVPELRGEVGNGLCFCLLHDKAFEVGLFTIDKTFCIYVHKEYLEFSSSQWCQTALLPYHGCPIRRGRILPLEAALYHHWKRIGISLLGLAY